jgi:tripartite-type tricarboxylate transporter receptor subunit TctC
MMKRFILLAAIFSLFLLPGTGQADDPAKFPERPITLTGGYAAGGSTDLVCRAIASYAQKFSGRLFVVVAKPGGAGLVSLQNLASAKADGYTMHLGRPAELSIGPLIEKYPFKVENEFIPVAQMGIDPIVFSVNADSPWKTIEEVVAAAKKEPEKIKFAVSSPTATTRLALEKFCYEAGIKLTAVPFKGGTPAAIAVAGGHIPTLTSMVSEVLPQQRSGKIRVLLSFTEKRVKEFPDTPTAAEKKYKVTFGTWLTVFSKKGVPEGILKKIETWMKSTSEEKEFISAMEKLGSHVEYLSSQDFAKYWAEEKRWMETIVKATGLKKP